MRPNHHQPKESKENCIQNSSHCAETLFSILQVKTLMPYCKIRVKVLPYKQNIYKHYYNDSWDF
jgi:hypothetical protein